MRLYHDHVLVKEPGTRQRTPWHQDLPYYNVAGRLNISMWIPVDPVPRESTLEFVKGSHLGPWYMPRTFLDGQAQVVPGGLAGGAARHRRRPRALPGDRLGARARRRGVLPHAHAARRRWGRAARNRRRVLSLRFLGDDMVHAVRDWATSPPFPGLADELADGAPLDHPLFPVVWSRCGVTVREILHVGNPLLREPSREVTPDELRRPETQQLIDDLIDTMHAANGAGIAAPQVGELVRIATIEVTHNPRYPYKPPIPLTVVVNPVVDAARRRAGRDQRGLPVGARTCAAT